MNKYSCFIMGLPEAGKTTFLASLWYCITNPKKNKLKFKRINKNLNYLSNICETWSNLETIPRTKQGFEELDITLVLEDDKGKEIELTFPDLSGETFQSQYDKREMSPELAEYIENTSSIILFINPMTVNETSWIADIPANIRQNKESIDLLDNKANTEAPMQVQLVELLQFVEYIRKYKPVKLQVLVSAWDIIESNIPYNKLTPQEYIKQHLPLLWQYIITNTESYNTSFWGISAQGGSLKSNERSKLLEIEDPRDRILVVDNLGNRSKDITLPLCKIVGEAYEE